MSKPIRGMAEQADTETVKANFEEIVFDLAKLVSDYKIGPEENVKKNKKRLEHYKSLKAKVVFFRDTLPTQWKQFHPLTAFPRIEGYTEKFMREWERVAQIYEELVAISEGNVRGKSADIASADGKVIITDLPEDQLANTGGSGGSSFISGVGGTSTTISGSVSTPTNVVLATPGSGLIGGALPPIAALPVLKPQNVTNPSMGQIVTTNVVPPVTLQQPISIPQTLANPNLGTGSTTVSSVFPLVSLQQPSTIPQTLVNSQQPIIPNVVPPVTLQPPTTIPQTLVNFQQPIIPNVVPPVTLQPPTTIPQTLVNPTLTYTTPSGVPPLAYPQTWTIPPNNPWSTPFPNYYQNLGINVSSAGSLPYANPYNPYAFAGNIANQMVPSTFVPPGYPNIPPQYPTHPYFGMTHNPHMPYYGYGYGQPQMVPNQFGHPGYVPGSLALPMGSNQPVQMGMSQGLFTPQMANNPVSQLSNPIGSFVPPVVTQPSVQTSSSQPTTGSGANPQGSSAIKFNDKLAKIVPIFSGDILEFPSFYEMFMNQIGQTDLAVSLKVQMLKNKLKGPPLDLIQSFPVDQLVYALDALRARYMDPESVRAHIRAQMISIPKLNSGTDISTFELIVGKIRSVHGLVTFFNLDPSLENQITNEFYNKFPPFITNEFLKYSVNGYRKLIQLLSFMEQELHLARSKANTKIDVREDKQSKPFEKKSFPKKTDKQVMAVGTIGGKKQGQNPGKPAPQVNPQNVHQPVKHTNEPPCTNCNQRTHSVLFCNKLSYRAKHQIALELHLCLVCLNNEHTTEDCPDSYECFRCKGKHNRSICPSHGKSFAPNQTNQVYTVSKVDYTDQFESDFDLLFKSPKEKKLFP